LFAKAVLNLSLDKLQIFLNIVHNLIKLQPTAGARTCPPWEDPFAFLSGP